MLTPLYHCFSLKEIRTGPQAGQETEEPMQRPRRCVVYWLGPPGLLSLLSIRTQDQPGDATMNNGLGPPHQSLINKMINLSQVGHKTTQHRWADGRSRRSPSQGCLVPIALAFRLSTQGSYLSKFRVVNVRSVRSRS